MNTYYFVSEIISRLYIKPKKFNESGKPRTFRNIKNKHKNTRNLRRQKQLKKIAKYKQLINKTS